MWSASQCEVHHDAKSISMRIPSWCESHLDVNPIMMWIPLWCESYYEVNLIMKWISIWNKSKNDNEMNPKTPEKYSEFLIDWNVIKIETRIGILIIGKKGLFSRSCTESYFQSCSWSCTFYPTIGNRVMSSSYSNKKLFNSFPLIQCYVQTWYETRHIHSSNNVPSGCLFIY